MKEIISIILLVVSAISGFTQTNTFPSSGNVGIGTTSPGALLHIRRDVYGEQFRISAYTNGESNNCISIGVRGVIPAAYGPQTSYYSSINNGYAGDDNSLLVINDKGYGDGAKFADFAVGNGKGSPVLFVDGSAGNVGIGTTSPSEKFSVNGNISTKKLIVTQTGWSDYVFNKDYKLRSLQSLEIFIKENKHLPEVPTAKEVAAKGISVGDSQALLLKKIEEITLYLIELKREVDSLRIANSGLQKKINR